MMPNKRRLPTLVLAAFLAAPALAQESLIDIYQRALVNDPAVREAEATYFATAEVKPQARSSLLPDFTLNSNRSHTFRTTPTGAVDPTTGLVIGTSSEVTNDTNNWNIGLRQTIFNWGEFATLRQAEKRVTRAETDYEVAKQDLVLRVADTYFNVLAAEDNLASAVAAREAIARQLEQAQRRFEVGLIAITDVQQSQAGFDDSIAVEINAERLLALAHESLREIVGDLVTELAGPTDNLPLLSPDPADAEEWVQTALTQNLTLQSSRMAADIAADDIRIQRGSRLPTLSLQASYGESVTDQLVRLSGQFGQPTTSEPDTTQWALNLSFPIYTGGFNRSRIQQSVYSHRAATEALERVARQTERQTRDAYLGVISEISRVRALRQSVESNRTALRATEAGFEVGTQTTVDVLASQNNLRGAETSYSRSRYNYIMNVLRLKEASGNLSIADVEQVDSWLQ